MMAIDRQGRSASVASHVPCEACQVRGLALCGALAKDELCRLDAISSDVRLDPPKAVVYEGDPARCAFIVKSGLLRLTKVLPDGRRQVTGFLYPGDFLGLGHGDTYTCSAEAVTPAQLCRFERTRLPQLFTEFPALEHRMLAMASNEIANAQKQLLLLGRKTARERVASFLCDAIEAASLRGWSTSPLELPMSRADMADYLGLTIETVSRTLTKLTRDKLIELPSPHRVIVPAEARLRRIAAGEEPGEDSA